MFATAGRKKARPSTLTLVWSTLLLAGTVPLAWAFFSYTIYLPLAGIVAIGLVPSLYRLRGLKQALPEPYGRGKRSIIDLKSSFRAGVLIIVGGFGCVMLLFASVYFIPITDFFILMFSITGGFPLSQILFFLMVLSIERGSRSRIYVVVADETKEDESPVLSKTLEMSPYSQRQASASP